jgi:hypothetical protein
MNHGFFLPGLISKLALVDGLDCFFQDRDMNLRDDIIAFTRSRLKGSFVWPVVTLCFCLWARADRQVDYQRDIQPIFDSACVDCHGSETQKGGLRLDSLDQLALGGSSGDTIVPESPNGGLLLAKILHSDPEERMPPEKQVSLTSEEVKKISIWINSGAVELTQRKLAPYPEEAYEHWSLKPLEQPGLPDVNNDGTRWMRNPVDAFIYHKMREHGLSPSPEADRVTLIRRVYFDLIGLPPSPKEIQEFVSSENPDAYESLIDQLLASEAYGERWARHWLDVVHYADTHGYDKDKPRPNAWPYRDYVIRSFNADKPYSRFVEEQIAGDTLYPHSMDGITAAGFIASGPWDFIGHAEVSEDKLDGKVARHLDRDDMVAVTMNTFTSMTVQCARCHHHKFDPVRMEDYYSLQSVFAALDRADRNFDADADVARKRRQWGASLEQVQKELDDFNERIREAAGPSLIALEASIRELEEFKSGKPDAYGYHSAISQSLDEIKWVQVDLGGQVDIQEVILRASDDDFNGIGAGFGFPQRFKIEVANDSEFSEAPTILVDAAQKNVDNPTRTPLSFKINPPLTARFVRVTATRLALRSNDYIFSLAELEVKDLDDANVALGKTVSSKDSIEALPRWGMKNLVDGKFAHGEHITAEGKTLAQLKVEKDALLSKATQTEWSQRIKLLQDEKETLTSRLEQLPPPSKVYAGTIHKGGGAFRGTGHQGGEPRKIHVLSRGDVDKPGEEVGPGVIPVIYGQETRFTLPTDHSEGDRRVALARWILQKDHPLTWRSIVNRIWQYHFGAGICETPNDFGLMGSDPSHPELLDWLAVSFRDGGQSFKQLHRLILASATYRQSSNVDSDKASIDSGNRLLWRMNRRRLEAEAVRDSVLYLAGVLDRKMGGPAFMDFVIEKPEHSPHYEYRLHDPMDPASHRRSIYRFIVRSQQQPFMTTLDCADPSLMVGRRNETLTPSQSLALLNNPFMVAMAKEWGGKLEKSSLDLSDQIQTALEEITGNKPDPAELKRWVSYAQTHGLENTCRWMLNMNAFLFVD